MDAYAAAALLDEFKKLPSRIERPQTFMEIAGYPHYENVCSNFLAFFLDPEGPHGMGNLFLDALLNSVGVEGGEGFGGNVSVEREVVTEAGNRIDILIKTDSAAVLIENKIFAAVANPFHDYVAYLNGLKNEAGSAYENEKILLTLYPSVEGAAWGFNNVTHAAFAHAVRSLLGHHISEADTRYLTLALDFLNTLAHLGEGTRMNQRFVKLLAERGDEVYEFLEAIKAVRDELRGKVQELATLVNVEHLENVEQIPWRPNVALEHALQHRIYVDDGAHVAIDAVVEPGAWKTWVYPRRGLSQSALENLLNEAEISFELDEGYVYVPRDLDYDEDPSRVASVVQERVEKLSRAAS